jgi:hypothetical protein
MQSRSSRAKPWLVKSPGLFTPPAQSNRAACASDRSQLAADILNEDRVALAARLRDPGDDPPPYYNSRESTAADDEPYDCFASLQLQPYVYAFVQTKCFSSTLRRQAELKGFKL